MGLTEAFACCTSTVSVAGVWARRTREHREVRSNAEEILTERILIMSFSMAYRECRIPAKSRNSSGGTSNCIPSSSANSVHCPMGSTQYHVDLDRPAIQLFFPVVSGGFRAVSNPKHLEFLFQHRRIGLCHSV